MLLVYSFCVGVRFYYVLVMQSHTEYFYQQALMINSNDGYFYAQGARDILQDKLQTPSSPTNEWLSKITAFVVRCTPFSLEQIMLYLPGFLGALSVFPIMLLAYRSGFYASVCAGVISGIGVSYYNRTMFGYYDTDMLVIVLALSVLVFSVFLWNRWNFILFALLLVLSAFSLLYYPSLRYVFLGYLGILCCVGIFKKENEFKILVLGFGVVILWGIFYPNFLGVWVLLGITFGILQKNQKILKVLFWVLLGGFLGVLLFWFFPYLQNSVYWTMQTNKNTEGLHYLGVVSTISEMSSLAWQSFVYRISGHWILFVLGLCGIILGIFKDKRLILVTPLLILGAFAYFKGMRYTIYAVPILALGLGILWGEFLKYIFIKDSKIFKIFRHCFACVLLVASFYPHLKHIQNYLVAPVLNAKEAEILSQIPYEYGNKALSWWDYGYAIGYYARLESFSNGGKNDEARNYLVSLALSSKEEKISYNIAQLILANQSLEELIRQENLTSDEELLGFLRQDLKFSYSGDLYVILPLRMLEIFSVIEGFSKIDVFSGKIFPKGVFLVSRSQNGSQINFKGGVVLDIKSGRVQTQDSELTLKAFYDSKTTTIFDEKSHLIALKAPNKKVILCEQDYLESFFLKGIFGKLEGFSKILENSQMIVLKFKKERE